MQKLVKKINLKKQCMHLGLSFNKMGINTQNSISMVATTIALVEADFLILLLYNSQEK